MNSFISMNSIIPGKLFKRSKLKIRIKQEIIKAVQNKSTTCSGLNRLARKIDFKESTTNKNRQL